MLGLTSISGAPISTSFFNPNVTINVTANPLTLSIGSATPLAGALVQPTGSPLTLGFGSLTIAAAANVTPTATPFTLGVGLIYRKCYNHCSCECKSYRRAYDSYCQ